MFELQRRKKLSDSVGISLRTSLLIPYDAVDKESLILQLTDSIKLKKWFDFKPMIFLDFESRYIEEGTKGEFRMLFPPFSYNIIFTKVEENRLYEADVSGLLIGNFRMELVEKEDGILFVHHLNVKGKNLFFHLVYLLFCTPPHKPYMKWRFMVLKQYLAAEKSTKEKGNAKYEERV